MQEWAHCNGAPQRGFGFLAGRLLCCLTKLSGFNISAANPYAASTFFNGNDLITGSWGNDTFFVSLGNDDYNGGTGRDTIGYDVPKSYVTVNLRGTGYLANVAGKTEALNNIDERLSFTVGVFALDVKAGETTGSVYRLYQAALDHKPDAGGLKFWISQVEQGASIADVALGFVQSNEFRQLNPSGDTASMLKSYYQNVLHRSADAGGLAFWSNEAAGGMPSHEILIAFAESNENLGNTAATVRGQAPLQQVRCFVCRSITQYVAPSAQSATFQQTPRPAGSAPARFSSAVSRTLPSTNRRSP